MDSHELLRRLAYVISDIDRAATVRADDARVAELRQSKAARFLPVSAQRQPFEIGPDGTPRPIILNAADVVDEAVFLGLVDDTPWFAVGMAEDAVATHMTHADHRMLNEFVTKLPPEQASLLAYARGMVIWHSNHKHCGRCGSSTTVAQAGHSRKCANAACGHVTFPRTDPVVITAIIHPDGEHMLLGRQKSWPAGFYSCIAGFVEPGETLEAAVMREAMEETGVTVTDVRYMASQPWPFPASIMLGFRARATSTDISYNDKELEEARWFSRETVKQSGSTGEVVDGLKLANSFAIARYLIDSWAIET